jgi:hypothetical protein
MEDQPCHKAAFYTEQYKQKKRGQTSMPRVGFELLIPVFEQAKTFHALDCAATVMGVMQCVPRNSAESCLSLVTSFV